jgi:hypothetical protein
MEQKILFNDLAKLLRLKLKLTTQESSQGVRMNGGSETMSFGGGSGVGMGQTNVMTLDD